MYSCALRMLRYALLNSTSYHTFLAEMKKVTRIGVHDGNHYTGDVNLDDFWNAGADKYKCCCRTFHVVQASLFIAYAQMLTTFVFALFFSFYYIKVRCILNCMTSQYKV